MLILSRKQGESIVIGDCVTITVVELRGDKVRIGIDAPKSVSVHRREVYDEIQRSKGPSSAGDRLPSNDSLDGVPSA